MKVAIYVRVSTQEQVQEGYSLDAQTSRLNAYCQAKGWIVAGTYTDAGYSGSNTERPALQRLLVDVRAGLVDCVLVYKLDRLSRSQKDTLMLIEDAFLASGVSFVSMMENFDTSTPLGRAMVGILSVFAQLEREQIRERVTMGLAQRAKNGLYHGGPCPFGYTYEDGHLKVNPLEAQIVREIYSLFLGRMPIHRIEENLRAKYGGRIQRSVVRSALSLPIYRGVIVSKGKEHHGAHEAIVDDDTFFRAQELLGDRLRIAESKPAPFAPQHMLSGMLACGSCGASYVCQGNYSGSGDRRKYTPQYRCSTRVKKKGVSCVGPSYACHILEARVLSEVLAVAKDQALFRAICERNRENKKMPQSAVAAAKKRAKEIDAQIKRVLDLYQLGSIDMDEIKKRIAALEEERDALKKTLDAETRPKVMRMSRKDAATILSGVESVVASGDVALIRQTLHEIISKIVLHPQKGSMEIVWRF